MGAPLKAPSRERFCASISGSAAGSERIEKTVLVKAVLGAGSVRDPVVLVLGPAVLILDPAVFVPDPKIHSCLSYDICFVENLVLGNMLKT